MGRRMLFEFIGFRYMFVICSLRDAGRGMWVGQRRPDLHPYPGIATLLCAALLPEPGMLTAGLRRGLKLGVLGLDHGLNAAFGAVLN